MRPELYLCELISQNSWNLISWPSAMSRPHFPKSVLSYDKMSHMFSSILLTPVTQTPLLRGDPLKRNNNRTLRLLSTNCLIPFPWLGDAWLIDKTNFVDQWPILLTSFRANLVNIVPCHGDIQNLLIISKQVDWNENIIFTALSPLAAPEVVILTTSRATSDKMLSKWKYFSFNVDHLALIGFVYLV